MSPPSRKDELKAQWTGKTLYDVPTPSVVLDLAKLKANCDRMLQVVRRLSLSWRAHIKTHKVAPLRKKSLMRIWGR
jgi:D-serine ammonia-lyase